MQPNNEYDDVHEEYCSLVKKIRMLKQSTMCMLSKKSNTLSNEISSHNDNERFMFEIVDLNLIVSQALSQYEKLKQRKNMCLEIINTVEVKAEKQQHKPDKFWEYLLRLRKRRYY